MLLYIVSLSDFSLSIRLVPPSTCHRSQDQLTWLCLCQTGQQPL